MKENFELLFIGYPSLEAMLARADKERPVFGSLIQEPGKTANYMSTHALIVGVYQPSPDDGIVHSFRCKVGELRYISTSAEPFDRDYALTLDRAKGAWQCIQSWMVDHGFDLVEATPATKPGIVLGWPEFLELDETTQQYKIAGSDYLVMDGGEGDDGDEI